MSASDAPTLAPHPPLSRYYSALGTKPSFLRDIFNRTACDYDRVEKILGLGSGSWYRRTALLRAGLKPGMRVLDVAVGTGLVAKEEVGIVGSAALVLGVDPSVGMIERAVARLGIPAVMGVGEQLPIRDQAVEFLSMGYALRHLSNLLSAFQEYHRVLKPGGRLCILEITRPRLALMRGCLRAYMRWIVPFLTRLTARSSETKLLWEYYWDTIEACVEPRNVIDTLIGAGFVDVEREVQLGMFSEYRARKAS